MKLNSSNEVLAENKVLILYILYKIGKPITDNELLKIVVSITDMNYFYFQQFMLDLIDAQYIIKYEKDSFVFYELTSAGINALELTKNMLPGILRLKVDTNIASCKKSVENEFSIVADFTPDETNTFFVDCKIIENNKIIFSIRLLAGSREQAKAICDNWKENSSKIYPIIIDTIINKK